MHRDRQDMENILRTADAVCLDVDSTVCQDEAIDSLATYCGVGDEVKKWTKHAMGGNVLFEESFKARLQIINPSHQTISNFIKKHPPKLTPGVSTLVSRLQSHGCAVYLVSGGMKEIIEPAAALLNIPPQNIFANRLKYYYSGEYAGFDESCPTSRSGGKARVVAELKQQHGYLRLVMVGDGATDLEACPPADAFIGFGGNIERKVVKEKAKWFVTSFQELIDVLPS